MMTTTHSTATAQTKLPHPNPSPARPVPDFFVGFGSTQNAATSLSIAQFMNVSTSATASGSVASDGYGNWHPQVPFTKPAVRPISSQQVCKRPTWRYCTRTAEGGPHGARVIWAREVAWGTAKWERDVGHVVFLGVEADMGRLWGVTCTPNTIYEMLCRAFTAQARENERGGYKKTTDTVQIYKRQRDKREELRAERRTQLRKASWKDLDVCPMCMDATKQDYRAARQKIWGDLPTIFDLGTWEEVLV
ncbi:hypothetical protein B0H19DRAFT_1237092 [Mycena capillaripes]|nr:hypothetical protein B0H19DRAFT_1237092 [Mycena capillaripes]